MTTPSKWPLWSRLYKTYETFRVLTFENAHKQPFLHHFTYVSHLIWFSAVITLTELCSMLPHWPIYNKMRQKSSQERRQIGSHLGAGSQSPDYSLQKGCYSSVLWCAAPTTRQAQNWRGLLSACSIVPSHWGSLFSMAVLLSNQRALFQCHYPIRELCSNYQPIRFH